VASELKRLRAEADLRQQVVADAVELDQSALSRYEQAKSSMTVHVAEKLFSYYGVGGEQLEWMLELVRGSRKRGWLKDFTGVVPNWFEGFVALERDASKLYELAIHVVPGAFQTEAYAHAIMKSGLSTTNLDEAVQARMKRSKVFQREHPPEYWAVICESALRCVVGSPKVMADQLHHLIDMSKTPNITIQVLPNSAGAHPSMVCPFLLLRFDLAPHYGVVYMDYLSGSIYRDDPQEVDLYDTALRHLIKAALPETSSRTMMANIAKELHK
jgi:transcriptional regulator with XRE-family HTH domain